MSAIATLRRRGMLGLAWATFGVAIGTGSLAATTGLGDFVYRFLHAVPVQGLPAVLLVVAFFAAVIDVAIDGQPNQTAVYAVLLMPSLAISTTGSLARNVTGWSGDVLTFIHPTMSDWVGTTSTTTLAVTGVIVVLLMSKRVVKKGGGGKATGATTTAPAMTTTTRKVIN